MPKLLGEALLIPATGTIRGIYEYGCELFRKRMECAILLEALKAVEA